MAITLSSKQVWLKRIRKYFDTLSVYKQALTNSNFEGEVVLGGKVTIVSVGDVTVEDHDGPWGDDEWGELTDEKLEFTIDQNKRFKFKVKDEDAEGSILTLVDDGSKRAGFAIANTVDQFIASKHSQIATANQYGNDTTPIVVGFGSNEVLPSDALIYMLEKLANSAVVTVSPNVVIPIWLGTMLLQEIGARNTNMGDAAIQNNGDVLPPRQGLIAKGILGYGEIYTCRNVPNTSGAKYKVIGGDKNITFAMQIDRIKVVDLQNDFAAGVKGHYVYGAKLLQAEEMALGTFNKGTSRENA